MMLSTQGLVLSHVPYGENAIVAHILTRSIGLESYFVQGSKGIKKTTKMSLFTPLTCLNMELHYKPTAKLQRLKEVTFSQKPLLPSPEHLPYVWFMTDLLEQVLGKGVKGKDEALFDWLKKEFCLMQSDNTNMSSACLLWMVKLSDHLGIGLKHSQDEELTTLKGFSKSLMCLLKGKEKDYGNMKKDKKMIKEGFQFMIAYYCRFLYELELRSLEVLSGLND